MSYPVYGRVQVPEPLSALPSLHVHDGSALAEVDHETPLAVLDQSDLVAQGIHTSRFIPGCKQDAVALGSCTANTFIEAMAQGLSLQAWVALGEKLINSNYAEHPTAYDEPVKAERAAIAFYHICTDQTGNPAEEWPPTDCGSSGPYMFSEGQRQGVVTGQKIATAGESLASLLQTGPVCTGSPFFYSWEEPDAQAFIDGDGSREALEAAIDSGVAGGHEFLTTAIEKIAFLPGGQLDVYNTVLRHRNHWTKGWGEHGCFRSHMSTWVMLGGQCDYRQFEVAV